MKSLFIAPNESVYIVEVETLNDVQKMMGNFDLVSLGDSLMMAVKNIGLPVGLPPNHRATLFITSLLDVVVPIHGNAIVFMETSEDLDLKALPDWVQHAIAAPFN